MPVFLKQFLCLKRDLIKKGLRPYFVEIFKCSSSLKRDLIKKGLRLRNYANLSVNAPFETRPD
ncbi:protein of unknown function [Methylocaldum szegediense]|uniref:Uncharacterized protein n=1 Tax=Methylocaldum szegediense TaxID=73780 RepID=A0ABM9HYL4_9GAMM|nr:protein of unknown function [Methylocaldum szegediense]